MDNKIFIGIGVVLGSLVGIDIFKTVSLSKKLNMTSKEVMEATKDKITNEQIYQAVRDTVKPLVNGARVSVVNKAKDDLRREIYCDIDSMKAQVLEDTKKRLITEANTIEIDKDAIKDSVKEMASKKITNDIFENFVGIFRNNNCSDKSRMVESILNSSNIPVFTKKDLIERILDR